MYVCQRIDHNIVQVYALGMKINEISKYFNMNTFSGIVKKYSNRQVSNFYNAKFTKRALISYITQPFRLKSPSHNSNAAEVLVMAQVLHKKKVCCRYSPLFGPESH